MEELAATFGINNALSGTKCNLHPIHVLKQLKNVYNVCSRASSILRNVGVFAGLRCVPAV